MRFIWNRKKASPQIAVDRMHFVMWDFLKMLSLAVLFGLAISIAASILVLILSGTAEARTPARAQASAQISRDEQSAPTPGSLWVGDGCDGEELLAVERDWHVRVSSAKVEVRVMQTFQLPKGEPPVAVFHVQLPQGAELQSLSALAEQREWPGRVMSLRDATALSPAGYRNLTKDKLLAIADESGSITTSPLVDLREDEALVVQYTYVLNGDAARELTLPLESADDLPAVQVEKQMADEWSPTRVHSASGSVWVEWPEALPARVSAPAGAAFDWSSARIQGIAWSSTALPPGAKFAISWSM